MPQRLDLRLAGEQPLHLSAVVTPGHGALHQCADGVPLLTAGLAETDMIKDALEQLRQGEIEIPAFLAASPQVERVAVRHSEHAHLQFFRFLHRFLLFLLL